MVAGIIAEYNPFHKGHEYHIRKTKELTSADFVVTVLSGDFVQRGVPSVMSKYIRTRQALLGGSDLVLELPACFATASASDFVRGGIMLLNSLGITDFLSFGAEETDLELLSAISDILANESEDYKKILDLNLRNGSTYPAAREAAVLAEMGSSGEDADRIKAVLNGSNNILALEYLKILKATRSPMKPVLTRRRGDGYNDKITGKEYASASGIRERLGNDDPLESVRDYVPEWEFKELKESFGKEYPVKADDFIYLIGEKVRYDRLSGADLMRYSDMSEELLGRLSSLDLRWTSFDEVCKALKTKQYTYSRISRLLIHILLDITAGEKKPEYVRVLGFKESASSLLKDIKERCGLPVITKVSEADSLLSGEALDMFRHDVYASELYEDRVRAVFGNNDDVRFNEYKQNVVIV